MDSVCGVCSASGGGEAFFETRALRAFGGAGTEVECAGVCGARRLGSQPPVGGTLGTSEFAAPSTHVRRAVAGRTPGRRMNSRASRPKPPTEAVARPWGLPRAVLPAARLRAGRSARGRGERPEVVLGEKAKRCLKSAEMCGAHGMQESSLPKAPHGEAVGLSPPCLRRRPARQR